LIEKLSPTKILIAILLKYTVFFIFKNISRASMFANTKSANLMNGERKVAAMYSTVASQNFGGAKRIGGPKLLILGK